MPAAHDYVEFAVLKTAGAAIAPHVDDLLLLLGHSRLMITRPGGLSLTAPSPPFGGTPARWRRARQRDLHRLRQLGETGQWRFLPHAAQLIMASAKPERSRQLARLALARFCRQRVGAEALGVINLIQGTTRAAATGSC